MVQSPLSRLSKIRKYFRTRPALGAADIDGWRGREHVFYLFQNNDHELHQLIIDELILPYVLDNLHPKFLPEFEGGVALAFLKPHKEHLSLHCPQKIAATEVNSALREEMRALEPEA